MATIVNYEPLQLRFGGVFPDTSGPDISTFGGDLPSQAGGVLFDEASVAAKVTAAILGDTTHFGVRGKSQRRRRRRNRERILRIIVRVSALAAVR